jgi:hypothetical protein
MSDMTFPTPEGAATWAGILAHLGWDKPYNFRRLADALMEHLETSNTDPADRPGIHSNFVHVVMDHPDFLPAFYGCKVSFGHEDDDTSFDGKGLTVSFSPYQPQ